MTFFYFSMLLLGYISLKPNSQKLQTILKTLLNDYGNNILSEHIMNNHQYETLQTVSIRLLFKKTNFYTFNIH